MKMFIWIGIICFLIGIFIFGVGYHNIDLAVNMPYGTDLNAFGFEKDNVQMYLLGLKSIIISEIFNILGMILIIYEKNAKLRRKL